MRAIISAAFGRGSTKDDAVRAQPTDDEGDMAQTVRVQTVRAQPTDDEVDERASISCPVCLEKFAHTSVEDGDRRPVATPCGHEICRTCFDSLHHKRCPQCRFEFTFDAPLHTGMIKLIEKQVRRKKTAVGTTKAMLEESERSKRQLSETASALDKLSAEHSILRVKFRDSEAQLTESRTRFERQIAEERAHADNIQGSIARMTSDRLLLESTLAQTRSELDSILKVLHNFGSVVGARGYSKTPSLNIENVPDSYQQILSDIYQAYLRKDKEADHMTKMADGANTRIIRLLNEKNQVCRILYEFENYVLDGKKYPISREYENALLDLKRQFEREIDRNIQLYEELREVKPLQQGMTGSQMYPGCAAVSNGQLKSLTRNHGLTDEEMQAAVEIYTQLRQKTSKSTGGSNIKLTATYNLM